MDEQSVCKKAVEKFGKAKQLDMAIEECSELIKCVVKYRRYGENKVWELKMLDEMADVEIMLTQLKLLITDVEEFEKIKMMKLERLEKIIESGDNPYRGLKGEEVARGLEQ